ncbi:MAG: NAD(P)-dependent oxidoreductase [Chloroflexota bacterium]
MPSLIVVRPDFEQHWPYVADFFLERWQAEDEAMLIRLEADETRSLRELVPQPGQVTRMASLNVAATIEDLQAFSSLKEATFSNSYRGEKLTEEARQFLLDKGVALYSHYSEGFWGQSVSEFGLALTLCGLRRIPQLHHEIITSHHQWEIYRTPENLGPGKLGHQFGDDKNFTNGTIEGKRIRIVGAGNIGSRYASFVNMLGADVAAWDPYATEAHFHRAGSRREWHLEELVKDAEIFVPMLPITESTRGLITGDHIRTLPKGCLVVLVTRATICDVDAIRERVLADEISLSADVFDIEPVPLDDPLLGRHNVVHTPHIAGRTMDANRQWAHMLMDQFKPVA